MAPMWSAWTCGVSVDETGNLGKPVPFQDGSGRIVVVVDVPGQTPRYSVFEDGADGRQLVPITTPPGGDTPSTRNAR